jgi:cyclohexanecarboxyl-CoA dehydrogenase
MNIGYVTVNISLIGQILSSFGDPDVVAPWSAGMLAGELLPSIALTEPGGGSDAANLSLKARRDGTDYLLDGEKTSISLATQADFSVVFARTGETGSGARGISAFLVPLDLPGITRTSFDDHGDRSVGRGSLFFDEVRVPARFLLGTENKGFVQVMQGFDYSRALLGIQCLAVARKSVDETWVHAAGRQAFGKPLVSCQGGVLPAGRGRDDAQLRAVVVPAYAVAQGPGPAPTPQRRPCASGRAPSSPTTRSTPAC